MTDIETAPRADDAEGQGRARAEGHEVRAAGQGQGATQGAAPAGLASFLTTDARATRKASKILARGQGAKDRAEARAIERAAKADQKAADRATALQVERDRLALEAERAEHRRAERAKALAAGKAYLLARRAGLEGQLDERILMAVYGAAVSVALFSQTSALGGAFNSMLGLSSVFVLVGYAVGAVAAVFLELSGLYFARQALAQRKLGRSAWVYRILTWALVGLAAWFNYNTHAHFIFNGRPLLGILGAASSIIALLVYEGDAYAKARAALEASGQVAAPIPQLGLRFNWYFRTEARYARRAGVANPALRTRQDIIRAGAAARASEARAKLDAEIKKMARKATQELARKGQSEEALVALTLVADKGLALIAEMEGWGHRLASAPALAPNTARRVPSRVEGQELPALGAGPLAGPEGNQDGPALPAPLALPSRREEALSGPAPQVPAPAPVPAPALPPRGFGSGLAPEEEGRPDAHWANRTEGGFVEWEDRLAELAEHFPTGAAISRNKVKDRMRELYTSGIVLRHYWTNNDRITAAIKDLLSLRAAGYPDPTRETSDSRSASQANQD